jgi:hypothetical protein
MLKIPFSHERLEEIARRSKKAWLRYVAQSDSPAIASLQTMVYPVGLALHLERWIRDGVEGTDRLAEDFPVDLAAWMRLSESSTRTHLSCNDVEPMANADLVTVFRAGGGPSLLLPLFLHKQTARDRLDLAHPWNASSSWRGDCLEVYGEASSPAAPFSDGAADRKDAGAPDIEPDAGADASARFEDAGGLPDVPPRLADVVVRWTMAFSDEGVANRVRN